MDEATFKVTGKVTRTKVFAKVAFVTMETVTDDRKGGERKSTVDLVSFKPDDVRNIEAGDRVTVTGELGTTKVKDAKRHSDNGMEYDVYALQGVIRAILPERQAEPPGRNRSRATAPENVPGEPLDDTDVPF